MRTITRSDWISVAALLLSLPTAFIISSAILKYEFGVNEPFDSLQPVVESWGIKEPIGWNINLLILLGPVAGFLLAIFRVLRIRWQIDKEQFDFHFSIRKKWFPILVAAFSISLLGILFLYILGENCTC